MWLISEPHLNTMAVSWRNNRFSLLTLHYVFFLIYSSLNKKSIQNTNRYNFKCTKFTLQGTNLALQLDVQQTYGTSVIVNSRLVKCLVVPWTLVVVHAQSAIRHCFWLKPPTWWDLTWHTAQWLIFWITVLIEKGFLRQDSFRSIQDVSNLVSPATKGLRQLKLRVTGQGYAWFCIAYQKSSKCAYYTHVWGSLEMHGSKIIWRRQIWFRSRCTQSHASASPHLSIQINDCWPWKMDPLIKLVTLLPYHSKKWLEFWINWRSQMAREGIAWKIICASITGKCN